MVLSSAIINSVIINKIFASYIKIKWKEIECVVKFTVKKT